MTDPASVSENSAGPTATGDAENGLPRPVDWTRFRQAMPVTRGWTSLDHAAVGPIPTRSHQRMSRWLDEALRDGDGRWMEWQQQFESTRTLAAALIHADRDEIGLVPNTSYGINVISEGYPWQPGDNVVMPAGEFPSNVYPWLHLADRGVEVRQVPLDGTRVCPNRIAEACDERTRMVTASWVGFVSGFRLDPAEMAQVAHDHGALFFLDAIQGLGVFPIDVRASGVDFLAADGHKWLLGPEGAGLLYIRRELLSRIRPVIVGWNSVSQGNDYSKVELNIREAASRYESGTQNMVGFIGLLGSLETLAEFGLGPVHSPVAERVLQLTDRFCEMLTEAGFPFLADRSEERFKSGIVSFDVPGSDPLKLKKALHLERVIVSARGGRLRAAAHAFNDESDLERLIATIRRLAGS